MMTCRGSLPKESWKADSMTAEIWVWSGSWFSVQGSQGTWQESLLCFLMSKQNSCMAAGECFTACTGEGFCVLFGHSLTLGFSWFTQKVKFISLPAKEEIKMRTSRETEVAAASCQRERELFQPNEVILNGSRGFSTMLKTVSWCWKAQEDLSDRHIFQIQ